jgi:peptide subunit release factor 1 (eRF1)
VVADRTGADLTAWLPEGTDITTTVDVMDVKAVTKTQPGGWSQPRYQRRVENAWEASAEEVADVVMNMADEVRAKVIVVAGDVRAVELLRKALPTRISHLVRVVEGSRTADGSKPAMARAVKRMVKTVAAAETTELLRSFHEESGQADRASNGAAPTIEALSRAQVKTLLVHDDPDDERVAWFGPLPEQIARSRAAVSAMGAGEPQRGRLVDAAVRAALGTGAGVGIVPRAGGPADGLGAILRWS